MCPHLLHISVYKYGFSSSAEPVLPNASATVCASVRSGASGGAAAGGGAVPVESDFLYFSF